VAGAVLSGGDTQIGLTVLGLEDAPSDVIGALSVQPTVELLQVAELNPFLVYLVGIGFGIVFMMSAVTFGATIAQSVVEEKQTRIVEILMAAVPVRQLLAGKILGNSILAIGQVIIILVIAAVGLLATGQDLVLGELGESLVWFGVFFALGFVLLASLFATAASLVSRQEDVGSVTSPLMMLIMVPYVLVIAFNDNDLVMTIMSYVPFSAPVGMPMRLFMGTADWWEPLVSLVILVVSTVLVILLGAKIYSNSILRTGARVSLKEALAG
ncbi:ABC transporter permease, partial [Leucobacter sp. M11]|uniref:ABC transporter permease n=1 Tax=Leucobacter sp. M11 TaxID=2993565 RepID=UPI002D7F8C6B